MVLAHPTVSLIPGLPLIFRGIEVLGCREPWIEHSLTILENGGKGILGSLTLGGYDLSRFDNTTRIDVEFPTPQNTSLVVGVQNIIYHPDRDFDTNDYSLTPSAQDAFYAAIDSTLPYLELPESICDTFAKKFHLTFEKDMNLYTVNSSAHAHNKQQNATVTFKIGKDTEDINTATTIQLPYDAFDLEGVAPLFLNSTQYFPLRRSTAGQNILGRAFLQETYVIVDYERSMFAVAPATWSNPMPSADIQSIYWKGYVLPANTTGTTESSDSGGRLSGGAIARILVGILVVLGLLAVAAFWLWKRRRQQHRLLEAKASKNTANSVKYRGISELDSGTIGSPETPIAGYYNRERKDDPFPPISEMESPPAELYSPPPESLAGLSAGGTP